MSAVSTSALTREELVNAALLYQGFAKRLLQTVRDTTGPDWKVRRECEDLADEYRDTLHRELRKGVANDEERRAVERTAARHDLLWSAFPPGNLQEPGTPAASCARHQR